MESPDGQTGNPWHASAGLWAVRDRMVSHRTFKYRCEPWSLRSLSQAFGILFFVFMLILPVTVAFGVSVLMPTLLIGTVVLFIVFGFTLLIPPTLEVSRESMRIGEGNYDPRALIRIEGFRVAPHPYASGSHALVFVFERERRPRRVPLFVTARELRDIVIGVKPLLGDIPIKIRLETETPVKLIL